MTPSRLFAMTLLASACDLSGAEVTDQECTVNADCDDGLFCTGVSVCGGGVCVDIGPPDCSDGLACTEDLCDPIAQSCRSYAPDLDNDGFGTDTCLDNEGAPLGQDCDDSTADRSPANVEVCDPVGLDEDCNPETFGAVDADLDGHYDAQCCNYDDDDDAPYCGTDCDDGNPAIVPGAQVCSTEQQGVNVLICQSDGAWLPADCVQSTCFDQPNGLGVCLP